MGITTSVTLKELMVNKITSKGKYKKKSGKGKSYTKRKKKK